MNDRNPSLRNSAGFDTSSCLVLILAIALFCTTGCEALRDADKKRLPSISKSRPLGTASGPKDSASIKRIDFHPLGETTPWSYGKNDFTDPKRTMDVKSNSLNRYNGSIVGFVKFDKPGYLQERVYDDVYGDVCGGWSPRKLEIKPSKKPVYVSFGMGSDASGGQIHEVCWFPDGEKDGVLIYSTAYPEPGQKLTAADVYGPEQLGNEYQFWDNVAADALNINLKNGKFENVQKILNDSAKLLSTGRGGVNGSTGKPISQKTMNAAHWSMIRAYELGFALGEPTFNVKKKELEDVINSPHWTGAITIDEREYRDMLPIYAWLNDQITNKKSALPQKFAQTKNFIAGHDPTAVAAYLQADAAHENALAKPMYSNTEFWIAVKNFLRKDYKNADIHLKAFFEDKHNGSEAFEVAAAAKLRDFEFFELHPEK